MRNIQKCCNFYLKIEFDASGPYVWEKTEIEALCGKIVTIGEELAFLPQK